MKKMKMSLTKNKSIWLIEKEKIYIQIVSNCKADSLLSIIRGKIDTNSVINTD